MLRIMKRSEESERGERRPPYFACFASFASFLISQPCGDPPIASVAREDIEDNDQ
jgi:hypothetical protein